METRLGGDKMAAIFQTTFSRTFFLSKNAWISIEISLKFIPKGPINNVSTLVQITAQCQPGHKPLAEPMVA